MRTQHITIADVARACGVSVATVSRALLDYPQVNARTRERVVRAVRALGYVPNRAARSLVVRATQTLGLLIPDATDPIHGQLVAGFEQEAAAYGYIVILANGLDDPARERRAIESFVMSRADGIALLGSVLPQREVRRRVRPSPVVFVDGEHPGLAGYQSDLPTGCIRADDIAGMQAVVQHLLETGFRSIAYAGGTGNASDLTRREAVAKTLQRSRPGATLRTYVWRAADWDPDTAVVAAIARDRPDAVICYDDKMALSLIDGLRTHGVRVPRDVAVVGFDDIPFARLANPRLTTIAQPVVDMGRQAAAMLLRAIQKGTMPRSVRLPVRLIVRESTVHTSARPGGRSVAPSRPGRASVRDR
ncbi:MAG: LacI family DNA-binding transcriptional regulator [Armatimonadota bacterium]|nr:LacI family DNA-binding transcriptional regulator [Armatimonadota bacterium]